jgi:hypothetical protein
MWCGSHPYGTSGRRRRPWFRSCFAMGWCRVCQSQPGPRGLFWSSENRIPIQLDPSGWSSYPTFKWLAIGYTMYLQSQCARAFLTRGPLRGFSRGVELGGGQDGQKNLKMLVNTGKIHGKMNSIFRNTARGRADTNWFAWICRMLKYDSSDTFWHGTRAYCHIL